MGDEKNRRFEIAEMTRATLMKLVASRPGQVTGAMIHANAQSTYEACTAIYDACERFALSPAEQEKLVEQEAAEAEREASKAVKAQAKALKDAKEQAEKDAAARRKLEEIQGGG